MTEISLAMKQSLARYYNRAERAEKRVRQLAKALGQIAKLLDPESGANGFVMDEAHAIATKALAQPPKREPTPRTPAHLGSRARPIEWRDYRRNPASFTANIRLARKALPMVYFKGPTVEMIKDVREATGHDWGDDGDGLIKRVTEDAESWRGRYLMTGVAIWSLPGDGPPE